jgi:hypothetical protein
LLGGRSWLRPIPFRPRRTPEIRLKCRININALLFLSISINAPGRNCGCVHLATGVKPEAPAFSPNRSRAMAENSPSPRVGSTSKPYIIRRLRDLGLLGLVTAIEQGRVSAHTVACELGWVRRPPVHGGSPNAAKRRRHQVNALIREGLFDAPARQD